MQFENAIRCSWKSRPKTLIPKTQDLEPVFSDNKKMNHGQTSNEKRTTKNEIPIFRIDFSSCDSQKIPDVFLLFPDSVLFFQRLSSVYPSAERGCRGGFLFSCPSIFRCPAHRCSLQVR